jgi:hypothetical protein
MNSHTAPLIPYVLHAVERFFRIVQIVMKLSLYMEPESPLPCL